MMNSVSTVVPAQTHTMACKVRSLFISLLFQFYSKQFTFVEIISDPAYPGQWRVNGNYIEQVAKMTHWEYPEAVERFGRQLEALGIAAELNRRGAVDGDLVMVDKFDFEFAPGMTNPYIPADLLERDALYEEERSGGMLVDEPEAEWRPFRSGGYLDDDSDELLGFNENDDWDMLDEAEMMDGFEYEEDDDIWQA